MSRNHERTTEPATASQHALTSEAAARADSLRRASSNEHYGRAALFAVAICVVGVLALMVTQLGWWAALFGPAYLAAVAITGAIARGRRNALLAVVLTTASTGILIGIVRLAGLG